MYNPFTGAEGGFLLGEAVAGGAPPRPALGGRAVDLSARQLRRPDLAKIIDEILQETGLDARFLSLDITETIYVETLEEITAALDELKRIGVRISIDDFGMGYSSLLT
jgi:EAL domain-containing protein (putative c-di-GMP-specific phosphodiesterase class I)